MIRSCYVNILQYSDVSIGKMLQKTNKEMIDYMVAYSTIILLWQKIVYVRLHIATMYVIRYIQYFDDFSQIAISPILDLST